MADFELAFKRTLGYEGTYSDDAGDPGGKTKFGITEETARAHGYMGAMVDMPLETAKLIYKASYWNVLSLDSATNQAVANEVFDTAVNCGTGEAAHILQTSLNLLNKEGALYPDLEVDSHAGPVTIAALNACTAISPAYQECLLKTLNALQVAFYATITEKNPKLERFFLGWVSQRDQEKPI